MVGVGTVMATNSWLVVSCYYPAFESKIELDRAATISLGEFLRVWTQEASILCSAMTTLKMLQFLCFSGVFRSIFPCFHKGGSKRLGFPAIPDLAPNNIQSPLSTTISLLQFQPKYLCGYWFKLNMCSIFAM